MNPVCSVAWLYCVYDRFPYFVHVYISPLALLVIVLFCICSAEHDSLLVASVLAVMDHRSTARRLVGNIDFLQFLPTTCRRTGRRLDGVLGYRRQHLLWPTTHEKDEVWIQCLEFDCLFIDLFSPRHLVSQGGREVRLSVQLSESGAYCRNFCYYRVHWVQIH